MKKLIAVTVITIMLFTMSAGAIDLVATEDYHIDDEKRIFCNHVYSCSRCKENKI